MRRENHADTSRGRFRVTLSAVLLAGGESRRYGRDKATALLEGQALWQRQLRSLHQLEPEDIFISARDDPDWRPREIELVLDDPPSRGPMSGICAALRRTRTSHLLVLAVDMPFIGESDLRHLVSLAKVDHGVVPATREGTEPLAAVYLRESLNDFAIALASRDTSLQTLIGGLAASGKLVLVNLSRVEAERYRSVNKPEDLATAF